MTRYAVQFGYYSGILAGIFVDKLPNTILFALASLLTGLSFATLALMSDTTFTTGIAILVVVYLVVAGFSAALATL